VKFNLIQNFFERNLYHWGKFIYAHRFTALAIGILLTVAAATQISKIRLDSNLSALLPHENNIVKNLDEVSEIYGGLGYLVTVIRSKDAEKAASFVLNAGKEISKHPDVRYVEYSKPFDFFEKNMLLYADLADLKTIYYRIHRKFDYERNKNNPLMIDLGSEKDPGLYYQDLIDKYQKKYDFISSDKRSPYDRFLHKFEEKTGLHTFLILIKPAHSAVNIKFTHNFIARMDALFHKLHEGKNGIIIEYGGRYKKSSDNFFSMQKDFSRITIMSFGGMLVVLLIFFHSFWPIVVILIPLLFGISWTMGFVGAYYGTLNLITSFLAAILLGLGIDYGIHFIIRFEEEKRARPDMKENFLIMLSQTGAANTASALTTALAFFVLSFTEFRAFQEFGVIAGIGILSLLLAMLVILPALLLILEENFHIHLHKKNWGVPRFLWSRPKLILIGSAFITILSLAMIPKLWFDYDFSKIQVKTMRSFQLDPEINSLLNRYQNPTVILPESMDHERKLIHLIEENIRKNANKPKFMLEKVFGSTQFLPLEQDQKIAIIKRIRELLARNVKYKKKLSSENQKKWNLLYDKLSVTPLTKENLPLTLRHTFFSFDTHNHRNIILVFPKPSMVLGLDWLLFAENLAELKDGEKQLKAASDELIFSEILTMIRREGPWILLLAFLAVIAVVSINFSSLREGLFTVLPLIASMIWILGAMAIMDIPVDFFNAIMFPIIIGIGIDSSIHIYHRYKECGNIVHAAEHSFVAIFLSSFTTVIGFGVLVFAQTKAMNSIGIVAALGTTFTFLVSVFVLASMILIFKKKKPL